MTAAPGLANATRRFRCASVARVARATRAEFRGRTRDAGPRISEAPMVHPALSVDGLHVQRATLADIPALQALLATDVEFWQRSEGAPPRADEAAALMRDLPPDVPPARKHVYLLHEPAPATVVTRTGPLVAVVDLLAGFPEPAIYYLGLLYLAPRARDRGVGTGVLHALTRHVAASGGTALRLAVVVENVRARRLYDRLGFQPVPFSRRPRITWTGATIFVDVLELAIAPDGSASSARPTRA